VFRLRSAVALNDVEFDPLAFIKRFEPFADDRAEVDEYVIAAFHLDKSESLVCVKPLYCSCFHVFSSKTKFSHILIQKNRTSEKALIATSFEHAIYEFPY